MRKRGERRGGQRARWPLLAVLLPFGAAALGLGLGALWLPVLLGGLLALTDLTLFLAGLRGVQVFQTAAPPECVTGERVTLTLEVRGGAMLSLCLLERRLGAQTFFAGAEPAAPWQPLGALREEFAARAVSVGAQRAGVVALRLFSPLGLFARQLRLGTALREGPRPVLVLPYLYPADEPPLVPPADQGSHDRRDRRAGEFDSVSGSRGYEAGEPLSRVNWKLTAARRELYLKDFDSVGLRRDNVLYVAPFPAEQRQQTLEAALAGGALMLRGTALTLRCGRSRVPVPQGDLTALARALALCPTLPPDDTARSDALAELAQGRSCCAVAADGDENFCRLLARLPRGSMVFAIGAPGWRRTLPQLCSGQINLCTERTREGWKWRTD